MKIIVITSLFPHKEKLQYGTFVKEQIESLVNYYPDEIEIDVYFINGSESTLNYIKALLLLPKEIRKKKYDIAHVHYGLTLISTLFISIPIIVTFHGSDLMLWYVKIISKLLKFKASKKL